jgi:hypothetical protein
MKLTFTRTTALLAMAVGLAACGGKAKFELGGPVAGVVYTGLEVTNVTNGDKTTIAPKATSFKLNQTLEYGQPYDVKITVTPPHQTCNLYSGADTAGRLSTISIGIECSIQRFTIGGTVTGMPATFPDGTTASGLKITNGNDTRAIEISGAYTMPGTVAYNSTYSVGITSQPTGKKCTIDNPTGTVLTTVAPGTVTTDPVYTNPVNNINITCVPA